MWSCAAQCAATQTSRSFASTRSLLKKPSIWILLANIESIDIDEVRESAGLPTNINPDTIQTIEVSSLLGGSDEFSVDDEPPSPNLKTTPLGPEQTVEFVTSVEEAILAESLVTAHWKENVAGGEANPNATIRQDKTVSDAIVTRSSVVVKSRQFRAPSDLKPPLISPADAPDYELLDVIGEGGMGVVYAAKQSAIARTGRGEDAQKGRRPSRPNNARSSFPKRSSRANSTIPISCPFMIWDRTTRGHSSTR